MTKPPRVNIPILILSLGLSMFLWAVVYSQTVPARDDIVTVELRLSNVDNERIAVRGPSTIEVPVHGTKQQIDQLLARPATGRVDFANARTGKHSYPVFFQSELLREIATSDLPRADFEVELKSRRTFPVMVRTRGQLSEPSLQLRDRIAVPAEVSVLAPISLLSTISEARVMLDLDKVDPARPEPIDAPVRLYDEKNREIPANIDINEATVDPPSVQITPVLLTSPVRKTAFVQVQLKGAPKQDYVYTGYTVEPNQVTIAGSSDILATLSQVQTQMVDITDLSSNRTFDAKIVLPHGVTSATPNVVRVRVSVRRASTEKPDSAQ